MKTQHKAYCFGIATVLLWSTVASAFKLSLKHLDPANLLLYSSMVSIIALACILGFQGKFGLLFSCTRRQYLQSLLLGIVNPFLYYLVLFKAYSLLPAQLAQPINYTWALTMTFLSIPLLGQRIGLIELMAGFVCYSGVAVISTHGSLAGLHEANLAGVGLALFSTILWSLYWIFNKKDTRDPVAGLLLNFLFGLPFILAWCLIFPGVVLPTAAGLAGAAYVGLFEMGVTFALWLTALKLSENTARVGYLIFLSPFLSLVFIRFLVGEEIMGSTVAGLALIVAGLVIQQAGASRKRGLDETDERAAVDPGPGVSSRRQGGQV